MAPDRRNRNASSAESESSKTKNGNTVISTKAKDKDSAKTSATKPFDKKGSKDKGSVNSKPTNKEKSPDTIDLNDVAEDSSDDGEEAYEVEAILQRKTIRHGQKLYLVKWRGYSESESTWEPASNLNGCDNILQSFEEKFAAEHGEPSGAQKSKLYATKRFKTSDALDELGDNGLPENSMSKKRRSEKHKLEEQDPSESPKPKKRRSEKQIEKPKSAELLIKVSGDKETIDDVAALRTPTSHSKKIRRRQLFNSDDNNGTIELNDDVTSPASTRAPPAEQRRSRTLKNIKTSNQQIPVTSAASAKPKKREESSKKPVQHRPTTVEPKKDQSESYAKHSAPIVSKILCAKRFTVGRGSKKHFIIAYAVELELPGSNGKKVTQIWRSERLQAVAIKMMIDYWEQSAYWPKQNENADEIVDDFDMGVSDEDEEVGNKKFKANERTAKEDKEKIQVEESNGNETDGSDSYTARKGLNDSLGSTPKDSDGDSKEKNEVVLDDDTSADGQVADNGSGSDVQETGGNSGGDTGSDEGSEGNEYRELFSHRTTSISIF